MTQLTVVLKELVTFTQPIYMLPPEPAHVIYPNNPYEYPNKILFKIEGKESRLEGEEINVMFITKMPVH